MNDQPIGIIDSGSGGLSIWQSLRKECPNESIVYVGDHKYLPYGSKTTGFIVKRIRTVTLHLISTYSCKLIIVACNSATVAGIETYRKIFPEVPIIGVVPVIKTAAEVTKTGSIAVLATPYTTKSKYQKELIRKYAADKKVYEIGCPKLVSYIEKGMTSGAGIHAALSSVLGNIKHSSVDAIALGCTHYPFVRDEISKIVGDGVRLLDSGGAVARQTMRILNARDMSATTATGTSVFLTTGKHDIVSSVASRLVKQRIIFTSIHI